VNQEQEAAGPGIVMLSSSLQVLHMNRRAMALLNQVAHTAQGSGAARAVAPPLYPHGQDIIETLQARFGSNNWEQFQHNRVIGDSSHTILLNGFGLPDHRGLPPLKEAFHHAIDDGLVANNPVVRTGRFTRTDEDRRATIQPLTRKEVSVLLEAAETHAKAVAALLLCAVRTGLRQGELIGLQWGDVDFHGGFIEVRRAIVRGQLTTTKTRKIRRVDVTPQLMDSLKRRCQGNHFKSGCFSRPLVAGGMNAISDVRSTRCLKQQNCDGFVSMIFATPMPHC
jgi:Phage integrase family